MGVYIKAMEMPKCCADCVFSVQQHGSIVTECVMPQGRGEYCPLVEVKAPHGRLIDADKLDAYKLPSEKQDFKTWHKHSAEYKYAVPVFNSALDMVKNNAPTVIEREE